MDLHLRRRSRKDYNNGPGILRDAHSERLSPWPAADQLCPLYVGNALHKYHYHCHYHSNK